MQVKYVVTRVSRYQMRTNNFQCDSIWLYIVYSSMHPKPVKQEVLNNSQILYTTIMHATACSLHSLYTHKHPLIKQLQEYWNRTIGLLEVVYVQHAPVMDSPSARIICSTRSRAAKTMAVFRLHISAIYYEWNVLSCSDWLVANELVLSVTDCWVSAHVAKDVLSVQLSGCFGK